MLKSNLAAVRLSIAQFQSEFAAERGAYPHLARFADPADVLAALAPDSESPRTEKYALIADLLAAHQRAGHPLWAAILVSAFSPMLLRVRKWMGKTDDEDRDMRVVLAFLCALKTVRADAVRSYAAVAIERATKKLVFAERGKKALVLEEVVFDEESCSPFDPHALTLAEVRADLAWAARRAARENARRGEPSARIYPVAARRSKAA